MSKGVKAFLLGLLALVLYYGVLWFVIGMWSVNWGWALISLFLLAIPGWIYKKAVSSAKQSDSKLLGVFVKVLVPLSVAVLFVITLFMLPSIL